jgi:glutamate 5-kinase
VLGAGAVPVINENDSVATEEIRFGDNDRLAARVAQAAQAEAVVLLSDVDGLYDRDPRTEGALLLPRIEGVTEDVHAMASGSSGSGLGSGGMTSNCRRPRLPSAPGSRWRSSTARTTDRSPGRLPATPARCSCPAGATARARRGSAGGSG